MTGYICFTMDLCTKRKILWEGWAETNFMFPNTPSFLPWCQLLLIRQINKPLTLRKMYPTLIVYLFLDCIPHFGLVSSFTVFFLSLCHQFLHLFLNLKLSKVQFYKQLQYMTTEKQRVVIMKEGSTTCCLTEEFWFSDIPPSGTHSLLYPPKSPR